MSHLSAICISLVIVSVLVQNASGKRGCAAFGHACYGGHGKRSSSLPEALVFRGGSNNNQLEGIQPVPLPYAKLALLERSKNLDNAPAMDSSVAIPVGAAGDLVEVHQLYGGRAGDIVNEEQQDRFEKEVRSAVSAILRSLLTESRIAALQRQQDGANFQNGEVDTQKK